ncbi:cytochrome c oxidase cbb3-type subunit III [Methylacidimicrobium cyclopophantes]|uniref:Cytochrome c oxidase cbb3-type subunit III n=1 Tax=Methylacidimicrobium cyclopophantes TaxID=1041766 RepID=A0A5E6MEK8_9BACT|nr:c-type cytochrome [Methylacidimicrobium cyclopophantes]VVM07655.1 cytochrome c oxidase cbb3-type subunit III [Methylacidimicrobium cyclopophantes]
MLRRLGYLLLAGLALVGALVLVGGVLAIRQGFGSRQAPPAWEAFLAKRIYRLSIPEEARLQQNPFPPTRDWLQQGMEHYADHCAQCHANNGSGETEMGKTLYPRPPDMRKQETQSLTDGELYYIIHNGIRMTGMPAWGEEGHDAESWKLVLFLRHLPKLTREEEREMEKLNPKGPKERAEEREEESFLEGDDKSSP